MDSHFHVLMNTYDYEDALFRIDPNLKDFRDLKKMYVQFNSRNGGNPLLARNELKELIQTYKSSRFEIFRDFASLLKKFEDPIVNSFIMVEKIGNGKIYDARLSNGPIESINRKVKDLKRLEGSATLSTFATDFFLQPDKHRCLMESLIITL